MTIGEYPLYMVPLDEDVLSFELDLGFKVRFFFVVAACFGHFPKICPLVLMSQEFLFMLHRNVQLMGI